MATPLTSLLALLVGPYPILYLSIILHEAGHAVAGAINGYTITAFGMGTGKPFLVLRLRRGCRFYLCRQQPLQGLTWAIRPGLFAPTQDAVLLLLGGAFANLILFLLGLALICFTPTVAIWGWIVAGINGLLFVATLVPLQSSIGTSGMLRSDGAQVLALLRRTNAYSPVSPPAAILFLRPLWAQIGDDAMLKLRLIATAAACLEVDDTQEARRYLEETLAVPPIQESLAFPEAYITYIEGILLAAEGDTARAVALLQKSTTAFDAQGYREAAYQTHLAYLRTKAETPTAFTQEVKPEIEAAHPPFVTLRRTLEVTALVRSGVVANVDSGLAHYEFARTRYRYDAADLEVYRAVAFFREKEGDDGGASVAYEQAIAAAKRIYDALASEPDFQDRFGERCQSLIDATSICLTRLGRTADSDRIRAAIPDAEGRAAQRKATEEKRLTQEQGVESIYRRRFKWGLILTLFNLGCALSAYLVWLISPTPASSKHFPFILAVSFGLTSVMGLFLCGISALSNTFTTRRPIAVDPTAGLALLTFALLAYLLTGALLVLVIFIAPPSH